MVEQQTLARSHTSHIMHADVTLVHKGITMCVGEKKHLTFTGLDLGMGNRVLDIVKER